MLSHLAPVIQVGLVLWLCTGMGGRASSQEPPPPVVPPPAAVEGMVPGVDVLGRGPVHEAFATPTPEPRPTPLVAKQPPAPLDEMPPAEKPEGEVVWIGGYWAWDDDRADYLWVSGCWRTRPPGKEWISGYWREQSGQWQWVPGFWVNASESAGTEVTYYPQPPAPPRLAPPGEPPAPDSFYVPGHWQWTGTGWAWRSGYWGRVQPGYVWVAAHYRWTPFGFVFVGGYWDQVVPARGVLYAPVVVDIAVVGPRFVYTPTYAVCDAVLLDALFVRPAYCHYYFGDYYGPRYRTLGFESCFVYSRHHYDALVVYGRWEHRRQPRWLETQINLTLARDAGQSPRPPRNLAQQRALAMPRGDASATIIPVKNETSVPQVLAPARSVVAARGAKAVAVDTAAREQALTTARAGQRTAQQRRQTEVARPFHDLRKPRVASLNRPAGTAASPPVDLPAKREASRPERGAPLNPSTVREPRRPVLQQNRLIPQAPQTGRPVGERREPLGPPPGPGRAAPPSAAPPRFNPGSGRPPEPRFEPPRGQGRGKR